ncbi:MAG: iron-containing alcohol dehydrogenase [Treponemataceae bacterium]
MSVKKMGCRIFQGVFAIIIKLLKENKQETLIGKDKFQELPLVIKNKGLKNPMIVSGARVSKTDFFIEFEKKLKENFVQYTIFNEVKPDPTVSQITQMSKIFMENKCDCCVAVGGGSNIDAAKAMCALTVKPGKDLKDLGGIMKVNKKIPYFIAVPTTAGTGSECTVAAVVTDDSIGRKYAVNDPVLLPSMAVLDSVLTVSLPQKLTAYTGMDALTHAVEAYLNKMYYKKNTKSQSEFAIKNIFSYLKKAYDDGSNIEARQKMLEASYQAGLAFTTSCVGNVHAIAHTLGGLYHIQHGLANAVILPKVLEEYRPKIDKDLACMADLIGICSEKDEKSKADAFINAIYKMNESMDIPKGFSEIQDQDIPKMATWADREANPLYPVPVIFDKARFESVIRKLKI